MTDTNGLTWSDVQENLTIDYTSAERAYAYEHLKASEGTTFLNKKKHVRMVKRRRPSKSKGGGQHSTQSKKRSYHQPPANEGEVEAGGDFVEEFKQIFQMKAEEVLSDRRTRLLDWCVANGIEVFEPDFKEKELASQKLFDSMEKLPPRTSGLKGDQRFDFIETSNVAGSGKVHGSQRALQVPERSLNWKTITKFQRGGVQEMPGVSRQNILSYSWGCTFPVSTIGAEMIHTAHPDPSLDLGVVSLAPKSGINDPDAMNGFRFPRSEWLTKEQQKEYLDICKLQDKTAKELGRGAGVASLYTSFSGIGYKWDRDTNNKSTYTDRKGNEEKERQEKKKEKQKRSGGGGGGGGGPPTGGKKRAQFVSVLQRMRAFAEKVMLPKLKKYMYLETIAIKHFWRIKGCSPYVGIWTGVTTGGFFWPRSHTDKDLTGSLLVCADVVPKNSPPGFDTGVRGGDWSFAEAGHVLKSESGCLYYFLPWMIHGTTKFAVDGPTHFNSKRYYSAFYGKEAVIRAAGTVKEVAKRGQKKKK
jgi:hypothetical protein